MKIQNVVIIGSGTMGSGIAAHLCNADIPVTLLDLKTEISEKARDRIFKSKPPLLLDKSKINNIKIGNISDNFNVVKEADWIVEAVVERIDVKHSIYKKIFEERKPGAIVSSNTSSIPIKILEKLYNEKVILDHGMEVGKELANVLSGGDTTIDKTLTEEDIFKLELNSFMKLVETKKTQDRIKYTLSTGKPLIN